jgi:dTDP-4-dehydrorhamnose reductase
MKILILGGTGMLGHQLINACIERGLNWFALARQTQKLVDFFGEKYQDKFISFSDVNDFSKLEDIIKLVEPDYIINCIGIIKQSHLANNYLETLSVNTLLPHKLEKLASVNNAKLIHISTDCVFNGKVGNYSETSFSDADDLYGRSKFLGEVNYGCGITLRTSIIGKELPGTNYGLVNWFFNQHKEIKGYTRAIFSGLTTVELSKVILDIVVPQNLAPGLYQVASYPISKYELLSKIKKIFNCDVDILPFDQFEIDRSLDAGQFKMITKYQSPSWDEMICEMKEKQYFVKR